MGGIGLSWNLNRYLTHTYTIRTHMHMHIHTIHTHTHNTQIQDTHIHLNNTEYRIQQSCSTHRTEQHRCNTENNTTSTHRTTQSCTHSFDFYHLQQYIKKLYNIAIYVFYTFCSPYLWGEQNMSYILLYNCNNIDI